MRILGIDYGEARVGVAITDELNITAQGLETIQRKGSDKIVLRRLDEIFEKYNNVDTIVVGMPLNMNGTMSERAEITQKFVHKLKCKYNKMKIDTIDERLTTVEAHKTMNFLDVNKHKKRNIVDTISAVYILETYMEREKKFIKQKFLKLKKYSKILKGEIMEENFEGEELDNIITLNDEDGNEVKFEFLDLIELEDEQYVVLLPVLEEGEEDDGEVVILKLEDSEEDSEQESYVSVDSEETLMKVFNIFKDKFKDEFDFVDGEE